MQGAFYHGEKQKKKTQTKKKNQEIYFTYAVNRNDFTSVNDRVFRYKTFLHKHL